VTFKSAFNFYCLFLDILSRKLAQVMFKSPCLVAKFLPQTSWNTWVPVAQTSPSPPPQAFRPPASVATTSLLSLLHTCASSAVPFRMISASQEEEEEKVVALEAIS